VFELHF
jgi:hypothetical protein